MRKSTKRLTRIALTLSLSMVFAYVEFALSFTVGVPGVKLGAANIVCLFALYRFSLWEAAAVHFGRIALFALIFGSPLSFAYSLFGGALAFFAMLLLVRTGLFGPVGVSVGGSVFHSIGQLAAAALVTHSAAVFSYLPLMLVWSTLFGVLTGALCAVALKRIRQQ